MLEPYRIEIVFWGLRDLKKMYMLPIMKPKIKLDICGEILQSETISDTRKSLNFPDPVKYIDVVCLNGIKIKTEDTSSVVGFAHEK